MQAITVRVPGSTSNLSHGFDCMGMAVGLYNTITVTQTEGTAVSAANGSAEGLDHFAARIHAHCAQTWQTSLPSCEVAVTGDVPMSRGLGSSATVLLGVVAGIQCLANRPFDRDEVVRLATELEGHPDNTVAAGLGGFTIAGDNVDGELIWQRFDAPTECKAVVVIPDHRQSTEQARGVLPPQLERSEAVRGWQRSALITAAIATDQPARLRQLVSDGWHEHYRQPSNPGLTEAQHAAHSAGAWGCILSGSGSTVLAFAEPSRAEAIASALTDSYRHAEIACATHICDFDNEGLTILAEP